MWNGTGAAMANSEPGKQNGLSDAVDSVALLKRNAGINAGMGADVYLITYCVAVDIQTDRHVANNTA